MDNSKKISWMGIAIAAMIAVADYLTHINAVGELDYQKPTFWLGLAGASIYAVKAHLTKGTEEQADKAGVKPEA